MPNGPPDSDSASSDTEGMTGETQDSEWYPDPYLGGTGRLRALKPRGTRGEWLDDVRPLDEDYKPATDVELPKPTGFQTPDSYTSAPTQDAPAPPGTPALPATVKQPRAPKKEPAKPGSQPKLNLSNLQTPTASSSGPRDTSATPPNFNRPTPNPEPPAEKADQPPLLFAKAASEPTSPPSEQHPKPPTPEAAPGFQVPGTSGDPGDDAGASPEEIADAFSFQKDPRPETPASTHPDRPTPLGRKFPLPQVPGREMLTWALTILLALTALVAPRFIPTATQVVHADCKPLTGVLTEYRDATSYEVTDEAHGRLAAAASSGELPDGLMELVSTAVDEDDLEPVVKYCLLEDKE